VDANSYSPVKCSARIAVAVTAGSNAVAGTVQSEPAIVDYPNGGLTANGPIYASATAGGITQIPTGYPARLLGFAHPTDQSRWYFYPWLAQPKPYAFTFAASDETTALTTGTAKITFRAECDFRLDEIVASLARASSSGPVIIVVKKNGGTVFSTNLTINENEKTSSPATLSVREIAKVDEITVDITGAGTNAAGLKVALIGER